MKRFSFLLLVWCIGLSAQSQTTVYKKPWTFWYWMYGAVSEAGIKADLQAMSDVGLGGCYLMPIRGTAEAPSTLPPLLGEPAQQLTPRFWSLVDYAMQQADSLGLQLGIHICDGFALAGGPWISPEESMQKVVWSDTIVNLSPAQVNNDGLLRIDIQEKGNFPLPAPAVGDDGYYEDIAVFALKIEQPLPAATLSGTIVPDDNGTFRSKEPGYIQYDYDQPQTVRSVEVIPSGNNLQAQRLLVQASTDGISFHDVRQLTPPRQGWQNTDQNYTYSLPKTTARHFRFSWTPEGTEPGAEDLDAAKWSPVLKVKDIRLSAQPCIDQYESKNGSVWRIADSSRSAPHSSVSTTYRILRFGHTTTGHTNATAGGAKGLECDKFSTAAVNKQLDGWFGEFMKRPHSQVVKFMHVDSWECGSQNWSSNFADEFQKRRGYDLLPFLPVYAGVPIDGMPEAVRLGVTSEAVLRDIRLTINDLLHDVFFAAVKERAIQNGVQLSCESVAPTMVSDGMEHYKYADIPMGEYWLNSPTHDKPNDMLDAISGAHIYGKQLVQAEGFTEVRGVWDETPAIIKPLLDRNFALGMNRLFFHVFTHNPYMDKKPGMTLDGIGLFFQRDQTWFPEASALVDYITRCQGLLQQGKPVVDIAVYIGEDMPRRALTPNRLVPILPGLFGPERVVTEQHRLANVGQPMEESPVGVRHSAGILDLKDWINPLHGYQYDSMNPDALLHQPFHYKVLAIPPGTLVCQATRERIEELQRQGVLIIDQPYAEADFSAQGLQPDVILPPGIAYTHRHLGQKGEVYFLANQENRSCQFTASFRAGQYTEVILYNPMADSYTLLEDAIVNSPRTEVLLSLPPYGSLFVCLSDADNYPQAARPLHPVTSCLHQKRWKTSWKMNRKWQIDFANNHVSVTTDTLFDWSRHTSDSIRFYSGHARYSTFIKYKGKGQVMLSLGDVHDIAHVWVNGVDCGIVWTAPYEVDISQALKKGKNKLEIEVVNTWHNALRGADQGLPPFEGIWTNAKYRSQGQQLQPAGLLGPVVLRNKE